MHSTQKGFGRQDRLIQILTRLRHEQSAHWSTVQLSFAHAHTNISPRWFNQTSSCSHSPLFPFIWSNSKGQLYHTCKATFWLRERLSSVTHQYGCSFLQLHLAISQEGDSLTVLMPCITYLRLPYPHRPRPMLSMHELENQQSKEYFQEHLPLASREDPPAARGKPKELGLWLS